MRRKRILKSRSGFFFLGAALFLFAFLAMSVAASMPHSHGAMESQEQCPLHLFAKQHQAQAPFVIPALLAALLLSSYIFPLFAAWLGRMALFFGSTRAPPCLA